MSNPNPNTGFLGKEAEKRVNAWEKRTKSYSYAMMSEFKNTKKKAKEFVFLKENSVEFLHKILIWAIGFPVLVIIIILGFYWAILDLLLKLC